MPSQPNGWYKSCILDLDLYHLYQPCIHVNNACYMQHSCMRHALFCMNACCACQDPKKHDVWHPFCSDEIAGYMQSFIYAGYMNCVENTGSMPPFCMDHVAFAQHHVCILCTHAVARRSRACEPLCSATPSRAYLPQTYVSFVV